MKLSWKLGEVAGTTIRLHATFLLFIAWLLLVHWSQGKSGVQVAAGVGFILALFGCVLLHELGHALTAKRFGIRTLDITLLPIGGIARLERMPEEPRQELWVTLAGPAVNVVIAAALFIGLRVAAAWEPPGKLSLTGGSFLERLLVVNILLVLFNLLPAFPMDGGRIFRALLATRMNFAKATWIATNVGQGMAFLFALLGFFINPMLLFIALFVWIGAAQEAGMVRMRSVAAGVPASRVMVTEFRTLAPNDSLGRAVELILTGWQEDFPILQDQHVIGVLTRNDLVRGLSQLSLEAPVSAAMRREIEAIRSDTPLEEVLPRTQTGQSPLLLVMDDGHLVGLITREHAADLMAVRWALVEGRDSAPVVNERPAMRKAA